MSGKISRHQLKKRYEKQIEQAYLQVEKEGPFRDNYFAETESKVSELMTSIVGGEDSQVPVRELGYDSLSAVRLQNMIMKQFQVKVPMDILYNPTVTNIAKYVSDRESNDQIDWKQEMRLADPILASIPENTKVNNTFLIWKY